MRVALLITCLNDTFYPRVGEAVVLVLRHFGCRVDFPARQTCCGQPAYNSGFHEDARAVARHTVGVFADAEHVVSPSASCVAMLRDHIPTLLADDPLGPTAAAVAKRCFEFSEFLRRRLKVDIAPLLRLNDRFTCHWPCHARGSLASADLLALLRSAGGDRFQPPPHAELCCGFGGMFAVDQPEISAALLRDKLADLEATGVRLVISSEAGCNLQMSGGAHRVGQPFRFVHLAEVLAESLGLMEPGP